VSILQAQAQDCTDENVGSIPGKWVERQGMVDPKDMYMFDFVRKTYQENIKWSPIGGDLRYGTVSGDERRPKPLQNITAVCEAYVYFKPYECLHGKINFPEGGISGGSVRVNDLPFGYDLSFHVPRPDATDAKPDLDPETETYTFLKWLPEVKDGYLEYFDDKIDGTGTHAGTVARYRILVKPGKLPYVLMSKKEYYEKSKRKTLGDIASQKAALSNITTSTPGYADLKKLNDDLVAVYQKKIDGIDRILKSKSDEALSQPAFQGEEDGEYYESRQAADFLRPYVVKPNMDYYDSKLPRHTPQLITLKVQYDLVGESPGQTVDFSYSPSAKPFWDMHFIELFTPKLRPFIAQ
jgi:hypothetical protein